MIRVAVIALSLVVALCVVVGVMILFDWPSEPAKIYTKGGAEVVCPGVIGSDDAAFLCGDVSIPRDAVFKIPHFGPRSVWW